MPLDIRNREAVPRLSLRAMKKLLPEISSSAFRALILGYLQRCGSPIPLDRDTAIKAGVSCGAGTL